MELNLPRLHADLLFMGAFKDNSTLPTYHGDHCLTNWSFTDWQGTTHSFDGYRDCTSLYDRYEPGFWTSIVEAQDDSGYQLDTTTPTDPRVIAPDGTVFHFPAYTPPANDGGTGSYSDSGMQLDYYSRKFLTVVDVSGNAISLAPAGDVLTDTMGLKIAIDAFDGISWDVQTSPTAAPTRASVSIINSSSGQAVPFDTHSITSCQFKNPQEYLSNYQAAQAAGYSGFIGTVSTAPTVYSSYSVDIKLPDSSYYELTLDSNSRLSKIRYPSGGYTRYDYELAHSTYDDEGDMHCNHPQVVVTAKHECTLASGSCSPSPAATQTACTAGSSPGGENTTCYTPQPTGLYVIDPKQQTTVYTFSLEFTSPSGGPGQIPHYNPPLETSHTVYGANSSVPLQHVDILNSSLNSCPSKMINGQPISLGEWCGSYPAGSKTTLYDTSGNVAAFSEHDVALQYPRSVLSTQDLDFSGKGVRSTTNVYESGGIYAASGTPGTTYHLLDRIHSVQNVDNVKGLENTATNTHDALGNLIQVDRTATGATAVSTKVQRNSQGDIIQSWDPMQFAGTHAGVTALGYGAQGIGNCPQNPGPGLPTSITNALNQTIFYSYYGFGKLACTKDENGQITMYSYDPMGRVSEVDHPDGGRTTASYTAFAPLSMTAKTFQNGSQAVVGQTIADGLGRTTQQILTAPEGQICTETFYDAVGSISATNNPRLGCANSPVSGASLAYGYDALGRKTLQTNEDGTTVQWNYSGPSVTTTDEAGHPTQRVSDGLGRLVQVLEPNAQNAPSLPTNYSYDGFGNLWNVTQAGASGETARTRSFTYNGFSQLITASNPETGIVCYGQGNGCTGGYDLNGNLVAKTDADGNPIGYIYDAVNRLVRKNASDMGATLTYDQGPNGIGRLTSHSKNGVSGEAYAYDAMGRTVATSWCKYLPGNGCQNQAGMQVQYDLAGNLTQLTYPDGRVLSQKWDSAGRLGSVQDTTPNGSGEVYFSGTAGNAQSYAQYWPSGELQTSAFGNGVTQSLTLNSRLQPCHATASSPLFAAASSGGGNLFDRQSFFNPTANAPCGNEVNNNGNIYAIVDYRQPGLTQSFTYDSLNRLHTATRNDSAFNQTYAIDSFGNMTAQDTQNVIPQLSVLPNNRVDYNGMFGYDNAGHLTQVPNPAGGSHSLFYEAEGWLRCIDGCQTGSYLNDALGQRSYESRPWYATWPVYLNSQVMAEYTDNGLITDYIYANGKKIAKVDATKPLWHMHGVRTQQSVNWRCGTNWTVTGLASTIKGVVVRQGDLLVYDLNQQHSQSQFGIIFQDGWGTGDVLDRQTGYPLINDPQGPGWTHITADLSPYAGRVLDRAVTGSDVQTPIGTWDIYIANMAIVHADGSVLPLFNGGSLSSVPFGTCDDNASLTVDLQNAADPAISTNYYVDDHLGTTQMELVKGGWPVWQGQFTPFGQEVGVPYSIGPQRSDGTSMHFKFTGKERDQESGLDYFGARYYSSVIGRFSSPDWASKPEAVPYSSLDNPQSLNLYTYVLNNPLSKADPDGHCPICVEVFEDLANSPAGEEIGARAAAGWAAAGTALGAAGGYISSKLSGINLGDVSQAYANGAGGSASWAPMSIMQNGPAPSGTSGPNASPAGQTGSPSGPEGPYNNTPENKQRMTDGKAPVGKDGNPVELHHDGQNPNGEIKEMTRTDHRGGENFKANHPNTGQEPSKIDRGQFKQQRQQYWKDKANQ